MSRSRLENFFERGGSLFSPLSGRRLVFSVSCVRCSACCVSLYRLSLPTVRASRSHHKTRCFAGRAASGRAPSLPAAVRAPAHPPPLTSQLNRFPILIVTHSRPLRQPQRRQPAAPACRDHFPTPPRVRLLAASARSERVLHFDSEPFFSPHSSIPPIHTGKTPPGLPACAGMAGATCPTGRAPELGGHMWGHTKWIILPPSDYVK